MAWQDDSCDLRSSHMFVQWSYTLGWQVQGGRGCKPALRPREELESPLAPGGFGWLKQSKKHLLGEGQPSCSVSLSIYVFLYCKLNSAPHKEHTRVLKYSHRIRNPARQTEAEMERCEGSREKRGLEVGKGDKVACVCLCISTYVCRREFLFHSNICEFIFHLITSYLYELLTNLDFFHTITKTGKWCQINTFWR